MTKRKARRVVHINNSSITEKRCAGCGDNNDVQYHQQSGLYICPACDPVKVLRDIAD